jgi:predicted acylesterase/phospholipase RssA
MPPLRIQLALQGGGAKIAALLATLEAVNKLEEDGEIKVTRIAGTSAGSIAGCLYAGGKNLIQIARTRLAGITVQDVAKTFPEPWPPKILSSRPLKRPLMLYRLMRGNPLWQTTYIESLLAEVLKESGDFRSVGDLRRPRDIEVKIVATDLTNAQKIVYDGDSPLMTALMNSCGIPYCFRTWNSGGSPIIVDGGICENLPSEELDGPQDIEKFGMVVGVSFKRPPAKTLSSPISFSAALLDTAMQNSMERARSRLGSGSVFTIDTDLGTFDFVEALKEGLKQDGRYGYVKKDATAWFKDFVDRQKKSKQVIVGDPWATQGIPFLEKLGKVYKAQHASTRFRYDHCSVSVLARCLIQTPDADYKKPDLVHYRGTFTTLEDDVYCHRILVSDARQETTLERTSWTVTDVKNGQEIQAIDLPMRTAESENGRNRELLLFLDPVLKANSGPYIFDFQNLVDDFLRPLQKEGKDELVFVPGNAKGNVGQVDLVVWIPRAFPNVILSPQQHVGGRLMTPSELTTYPAPPNYKAVGWTGSNVRSDVPFGIDINIADPL